MTLCAVCTREAHGFGYTPGLRLASFGHHRFCSMACLDAGVRWFRKHHTMIDKTAHESQALIEARRPFAEALTALGLMEPFFRRSAAEIDQLIEAAARRPRDRDELADRLRDGRF